MERTKSKGEFGVPKTDLGSIAQGIRKVGSVEVSGATREISGNTHLYTIIGIGHLETLAQHFHETLNINFGFDQHHFKPVEVLDFEAAMEDVVNFDLRGVTVTIPHKEASYRYIKQHGTFGDEEAQLSGAINTVINEGGYLTGWNTDIEGFRGASIHAGIQLSGIKASIIGCGGMGRAVLSGLALHEAQSVALFDTVSAKATMLAEEFAHKFPRTRVMTADSLEKCFEESNYVIQCTPEGMASRTDPERSQRTAVPISLLKPNMAAIDAVYVPSETRFIREARQVVCSPIIQGTDIVVYGGVKQIQLYLGYLLPESQLPRLISFGKKSLLGVLD